MIRRSLNPPVLIASAGAIVLFVLSAAKVLDHWTPLEFTYARDYITLPRCGLAVRFGTDMYTSSVDYPWYGPVGTGWVSHPFLCVALGTPLSYLPPLFGYHLMNLGYLLLQLGIIIGFGRRLTAPYRAKDVLVFLALGLFFPWYVMYVTGQYHALSVMALALALGGPRRRVGGFVLSAISKPVLGPAGLILLVRGHWREALKIVAFVALLSIPFGLFSYTKEAGLDLDWGAGALPHFLDNGAEQSKLFIPGWDQQISLALLLDEFVSIPTNLHLREWFTIAMIAFAVIGLRKRPIEVAIAVTSLWYFTYYARGHEYHGTLLLPVFAYLWTERRGLYRTWWLALLIVLYALPTPYAIFLDHYGMDGSFIGNFDFMRDHSALLFWLFLGLKPVIVLLLLATIGWTELRPRERVDRRAVVAEDLAPQPA